MSEILKIIIAEHAENRADGIKDLIADPMVDASVIRLYKGECLPRVSSVDAIISGGGPMGAYELHKPEYDFISKEVDFIAEMIANNKAVLGVCLGHQLLAHVLGGNVVRSPDNSEYGWSKITLTQDGESDELFEGVPRNIDSFQYHQDVITLMPANTTLLATSGKTKIQAFRYSTKPVWGVQFHPEVSPEKAQQILTARKDALEESGVDVFLSIQQGFDANQQPRKQIFYNFINALKQ